MISFIVSLMSWNGRMNNTFHTHSMLTTTINQTKPSKCHRIYDDIHAPGIPSDPGDVVPPSEDGGIGC